jgi:hypothetical protein
MGKDQTAWPSQKRLAEDLNCSREAINRGIKALKEFGYIDVQERKRDDGGQSSSLIFVKLDPLSRDDHTPCDATITPPVTSEDHTPCDPYDHTHKKDKEERQNRSTGADAVFEFWNEKAKGIQSWTVHRKLTRKYRDMINARINEHSGEDVIAFIDALSRQSWATNGKFPTDNLEYVCRPGTFAKHFDKLANSQNQTGAVTQSASIIPTGQKESIDELLAKRDAERAGGPAMVCDAKAGNEPENVSRVQPHPEEETLEMFERDPRGVEDARILSSL